MYMYWLQNNSKATYGKDSDGCELAQTFELASKMSVGVVEAALLTTIFVLHKIPFAYWQFF